MPVAKKVNRPDLPPAPTAREVLAHVGGLEHELHSAKKVEHSRSDASLILHCSCGEVFRVARKAEREGLKNVPMGRTS